MLPVYSKDNKMRIKEATPNIALVSLLLRGVKIYAKAINYICQKAARKGGEKATFLASYLSVRL